MALRISRELAEKIADFVGNYPKGFGTVDELLDAIAEMAELAETERENDFVDVE